MSLDFMIVGAAKAGTTWLADMLRQHPDVFIPKTKEIHYFNKKFLGDPPLDNINNLNPMSRYLDFFKDARENQVKWEASPSYLWDEKAANKIYEFNPNIKILALLRKPSQRTYSQYLYGMQNGLFKNYSIKKATKKYPTMLVYRSKYYEQIKRYFDLFPKENIKIFFFEDLIKDNRKFLKEIEEFIGVKEYFPENIDQKSNATGIPKYKYLNKFLVWTKKILVKNKLKFIVKILRKLWISQWWTRMRHATKWTYTKPKLNSNEELYLHWLFIKDIEKLEKLIDKDLSEWK